MRSKLLELHLERFDMRSEDRPMDSTIEVPTTSSLSSEPALCQIFQSSVPTHLGGIGGTPSDLACRLKALLPHSEAAFWVVLAQHMATAGLLSATNIGLRDYLLPDVLSGELAATVPIGVGRSVLQAEDTGRGWRLSGGFDRVPNLHPQGFSLLAPVMFGKEVAVVALRSEEDGLHRCAWDGRFPAASHVAPVLVDNVYFREDEILGGTEVLDALKEGEAAHRPLLCLARAMAQRGR
jgi:hypothetical protein